MLDLFFKIRLAAEIINRPKNTVKYNIYMIRPITNKGSQCFLELTVTVRDLCGLDFTTEHAASTTGLI